MTALLKNATGNRQDQFQDVNNVLKIAQEREAYFDKLVLESQSDRGSQNNSLHKIDKPTIEIKPGHISEMVNKAESILIAEEVDIYQKSGRLV